MHIFVEAFNSTSVSLSWSEASCSGSCPAGIISYFYQIHYSKQCEFDEYGRVGSGTTDNRMANITGLHPCSDYTFIVFGIIGYVQSLYSSTTITTAGGEGKWVL